MNKDLVLLRAVEMAAIASYKYIGKKNPKALDGAAVEAMTVMLEKTPGLKFTVINGEGELDQSPMLFSGQVLGDVENPQAINFDLSVDPVEGTKPAAANFAGSIATIALAKANSMLMIPEMYMEKFFVSPPLKGFANLEQPLAQTIKMMQKKLGHRDLKAIVLDKPRHQAALAIFDQLGIIVRLIQDGDVLAAIDVINGEADFVYGIGGAPEGVLMASLAIAANAEMVARLVPYATVWPHEPETAARMVKENEWLTTTNHHWDQVFKSSDLVADPRTRFFGSGITAGGTLKPISYQNGRFFVNTFMASHGIIRNLCSTYDVRHLNNLKPEIKYLFQKYQR